MKTYEEAKREIQFSAVISGGITSVDGKELVGKNGFWYLGGELVADIEGFLAKIPVDEQAIKDEMNR
ncbi:MAG: hypothetical protein PHN69_07730 [Candidatus Pacebacteria bacterium]|nr:hypothetical protein [Candidatus Paceibacterota bacterium]